MQKLIDAWRKQARSLLTQAKEWKKAQYYEAVYNYNSCAMHLRSCANQLSKVNTFKFCVGDEVTYGTKRLIILSRHERCTDGKLTRIYECSDTLPYDEHELHYHRNHPRQARKNPKHR